MFFFDLCCFLSIVGIWPRFIEPKILAIRRQRHCLKKKLRIVQFSDLHLSPFVSDFFLKKIIGKITTEKPDMIVFTGDFLFYSQLIDPERLLNFLNQLQAPLGCFAVLGNHDYEKCVGLNRAGAYAVKESHSSLAQIFKKFYHPQVAPKGVFDPNLKGLAPHPTLVQVLQQSPFQLLHNEMVEVGGVQVAGLGEYMCQAIDVPTTFRSWENQDGLVLMHNPDGLETLPRNLQALILSGHTHGGQVNIPGIKERFMMLEHPEREYGFTTYGQSSLFVSRGLGAVFPFRWFATPEIIVWDN